MKRLIGGAAAALWFGACLGYGINESRPEGAPSVETFGVESPPDGNIDVDQRNTVIFNGIARVLGMVNAKIDVATPGAIPAALTEDTGVVETSSRVRQEFPGAVVVSSFEIVSGVTGNARLNTGSLESIVVRQRVWRATDGEWDRTVIRLEPGAFSVRHPGGDDEAPAPTVRNARLATYAAAQIVDGILDNVDTPEPVNRFTLHI